MAVESIMNIADILGYPVSKEGLEADVGSAYRLLERRMTCRYVACANPHSLVVAQSDDHFRSALLEADVLLPDGAGIVLAGSILKRPFVERVAGTEFFRRFSVEADKRGGVRYFFLGSTTKVLDLLCRRLSEEYPSIEVAGTYSPPFKQEFSVRDNQEMIGAINDSGADVLWVGMTAPKQEKWIHVNRTQLGVPLACAIGAAFDFYAGTKKRAPLWMGRMGLEWLPRLLREPARLWRRNFVSTPLFLLAVLRQKSYG